MTPEELLARVLNADAAYKAASEARRAAFDAEDKARKEVKDARTALCLRLGEGNSAVIGGKVVSSGGFVTDLVEL